MGDITLGQVGAFILSTSAILGALGAIIAVIVKLYGKTVGKSITASVKPISDDIENLRKELQESVRALDTSECRNFLVRFLGDIERGVDIDPVEIERAYDIMQHYTEDLKQNHYIHARWNAVMGSRDLSAAIKKYSGNKK